MMMRSSRRSTSMRALVKVTPGLAEHDLAETNRDVGRAVHGIAQAGEDQDERVEAGVHPRRIDPEGRIGLPPW